MFPVTLNDRSNTVNESIDLFSTKDGADKHYRVQLEARDGGFILTGYNGRRGGALKAQPKIENPVTYAEAKKAYDALVKSKLKGGYTLGPESGAYEAAIHMGTRVGIELQRLTPASESDIERYLTDERYLAQPKHDGERRPVVLRDTVMGCNLNGFIVAMPKALADTLSRLPQDTEIDAEQVGDTLHVFDTMRIAGTCQRDMACIERIHKVSVLLNQLGNPANIVPVETAIGTQAKRALYTRLRATRQEGIVFKLMDAAYRVGKNDDQIKIKFVESATLQVASVHPSKRSVALQGFDPAGVAVPLGNVTIPSNHPIPAVGEIVEVEYLYVVSRLYQPIYKGIRTDRTVAACTLAQLKYRAGIGEEDAQNDEAALLVA
jgi:bifunctional non-homologous end joining protein LigD